MKPFGYSTMEYLVRDTGGSYGNMKTALLLQRPPVGCTLNSEQILILVQMFPKIKCSNFSVNFSKLEYLRMFVVVRQKWKTLKTIVGSIGKTQIYTYFQVLLYEI